MSGHRLIFYYFFPYSLCTHAYFRARLRAGGYVDSWEWL